MKKYLFKIILLLIVCQSSAQIFERKIDIAVKMHTPQHLDFFFTPTVLDFSFYVINNGPDTLWPEDSIYYRIIGNNPERLSERFSKVTDYIHPGDSFLISDTFYIENRNANNFLFGITAFARKTRQASNRPIQPEFTVTHHDNTSAINLRLRATLDVENIEPMNDLIMYPNPCVERKISIESSSVFNAIFVFDMNGSIVYRVEAKGDRKKIIDLDNLSAGVYSVLIELEDKSIFQKLILL